MSSCSVLCWPHSSPSATFVTLLNFWNLVPCVVKGTLVVTRQTTKSWKSQETPGNVKKSRAIRNLEKSQGNPKMGCIFFFVKGVSHNNYEADLYFRIREPKGSKPEWKRVCEIKACWHAFDKKCTNHWMPSTELYWKYAFTKKKTFDYWLIIASRTCRLK